MTITNAGLEHAAGLLVQDTAEGTYTTFRALAVGTDTTAADASDTSLNAEIQRGDATESVTTVNGTFASELVYTFSFSASHAVTEYGTFNDAASGGKMLNRIVDSAVNVNDGDEIELTMDILHS